MLQLAGYLCFSGYELVYTEMVNLWVSVTQVLDYIEAAGECQTVLARH